MTRIAIDIRPLQFEAYQNRGIGRFLKSLLRALCQVKPEIELLLVYSPDHSLPADVPKDAIWGLLPLKLPFHVPMMLSTMPHADPDLEFQFDSALESLLAEHKVDLFHNTYPFGWEFFIPRRLYTVRSVVTIFDIIPIIFKEEYLDLWGYNLKESFADRLGAAVFAQRVQTISAASARDIIKFTDIPAEKVDIIYPGVDNHLYPMNPERARKQFRQLGLRGPYIFSVLGFHYSKNLQRTIQAFASLPKHVRDEFSFVILCPLSAYQRQCVESWLADYGLTGVVRFLERVPHKALLALYNGASVVLHTTLYEGFGLPVLEAMACGVPLVVSDIPVLHEVAGDAAIYVRPMDPAAIADGVLRVLEDQSLQERLRAKGLERARLFTWEAAAQALLRSYQSALDAPLFGQEAIRSTQNTKNVSKITGRRLRIAFWSPLNPKLSGISDYSESLIAALRQYADVDCYVEGYQPSNRPLADTIPIYDARAYPQVSAKRYYDINLYQIGNNPLHCYIYWQALQVPGIVTLHDVVLYHLVHYALVQGSNTKRFWGEVAYSEGFSVAKRARHEYFRGRVNDYEIALHRRIVERSLGIVVHSQWAADRITDAARGPVQVIPMGCTLFPPDGGRFAQIARSLLGWPVDSLIIGSFGIMHRVKRLETLVRVYRRLLKQFQHIVLVLMGPVDPTAWPLINELQQNLDRSAKEIIYLYPGYVRAELMLTAMLSVDVGVNLRNPTAGETSATLHTMLAMGKPVIVSDIGAYREYPDLCCPKIPTDDREEEALYTTLARFAASPEALRQASECAWAYSESNTWDQTAQRYLAFIEAILSKQRR